MTTNFIKVSKASFSTGTVSLYVNDNGSQKNREIEGKLVMKLHNPSFMKGAWIKLLGSNTLSSERNGLLSHDLFSGEEDHYKDGLHQVLVGFGEGDNSHGAYLELAQGRHSWPFHFRLPHHAPATYFDGNINVSYRLVALVESPIIQTASSRIVLSHDWLVQCFSNYSYVRIKETHITENKELLQKGGELTSQWTGAQSGGILPSILSLVRTPVKLCIRGNPSQNIGAGTGASGEHCAMFPFQNKEYQYEVLCSISNLRCKQPVRIKTELYVEICTRSHVKHPYPSVYPAQIGQPNADEVSTNNALLRSHTATTTHLVWEGAEHVVTGLPEQHIVVKVPVVVDTNPRMAALNHKPQPYALQPALRTGKIVHYTMEGPLFRYRTMLKVSLVRGDGPSQQTLCAPVFGEIYILPPRPETDASSIVSVSSTAAVAPAVPRNPRRSNTSLAVRTDEDLIGDSEEETMMPSPVVNSAVPSDSAPSRVRRFSHSADLETPRTLPQVGGAATVTFYEDPVVASAASVSVPPPQQTVTALAPTRPISGHGGRPSRAGRNAGGIASFRAQNGVRTVAAPAVDHAIIAVPIGASAGGENVNPNIASAGNKTPHAKPTKSSHIIRVDAELLSRGPAAVVIDRNERRHDPIRTPQRFAVMYHLGTATVIDGTPVVIAPTPVMINTAEFRANRRHFAYYPLNTAERGARLDASELETPRCLAEGFQYNCAVDSNMGTPEPPRRYSDSISESFDGQALFGEVSHSVPEVAMPLPAEAELLPDESQLLIEAMHGATPRHRQLFRGTFDGVDWLALNHTGSAGAFETLPNTSRTEEHNTNDVTTSRTVEEEGSITQSMLPTTPVRSASGMMVF